MRDLRGLALQERRSVPGLKTEFPAKEVNQIAISFRRTTPSGATAACAGPGSAAGAARWRGTRGASFVICYLHKDIFFCGQLSGKTY